MGVLIVRLGSDSYVKWSTTVDAPVSRVMTRADLARHLVSEDRLSTGESARLLEVADVAGTSDPQLDLPSLIEGNRAGPGETQLTIDEIVQQFS